MPRSSHTGGPRREGRDPRREAVRVLHQVMVRGRSLGDALESLEGLATDDRALAQELCFGVLRWYARLEALAGRLLDRPLRRKDRDVQLLLLMGLYQLLYTRIPAYAAINETVRVAGALGKPWAKGLINAVMREATRSAGARMAAIDREPCARLSMPSWLLARLETAYPDAWEAIARASLGRPPMVLRVNLRRIDRPAYLRRLEAAGLQGRAHPLVESAIALERAVGVQALPGFEAGLVSVQDAGAQLAAPLLESRPGMRVLDACAAPGGKTGHILESGEGLHLVAVDQSQARLDRVAENLDRIGLQAELVAGEVGLLAETEFRGGVFDRILLDAPCSATGVIRRHPDIKWLRRPEDIPALAQGQWRMLEALWPLLREGGMLLYATCSVLPEENESLIERFAARHGDCRVGSVQARAGRARSAGWQLLPGDGGVDGFYYAPLWKGRRPARMAETVVDGVKSTVPGASGSSASRSPICGRMRALEMLGMGWYGCASRPCPAPDLRTLKDRRSRCDGYAPPGQGMK